MNNLDWHLDNILKASGSGLKNYSMQKTIDDMRKALSAAISEETEACAKLCDELPAPNVYSDSDKGMWDITSLACGDAIRARGEA
jgi:hypothetical protein